MTKTTPSRILNAAETLLLTFGYRKVTVDEVASRAEVGKGTVYLHWSSKRDVFAAVLTRDTILRTATQLAALTADPAEVLLHRLMRRTYLQAMQSPVAKAVATTDHALLGEAMMNSDTGLRFVHGQTDAMSKLLELLHEHGLLADDPHGDPAVAHRLSAVVHGAFVLEASISGSDSVPSAELDLDTKADALATTVRRAFEPPTEPPQETLRAAASELADLSRQWLAILTASLPEQARPDAPQ